MSVRRPPRDLAGGEAGFASVVMLALLVVVGLSCLAVADAANVLAAGARARTAADAAALAAAAEQWSFAGGSGDPQGLAEQTAARNDAALEACDCPARGTAVTVTVSVGTRVRLLGGAPARVRATARARLDPGGLFRP